MTSPSADVLVVGGGLAGLATAVELTMRGFEVRVIEATAIGAGSSRGNAGQFVLGGVGPITDRAMLWDGAKSLVQPDSYFRVHPRALFATLPYMVRFALSSSAAKRARTQAALDELSLRTGPTLDRFLAEGIGNSLSTTPYLYLYTDEHHARADYAATRHLVLRGFHEKIGPLMGTSDLVECEPSITERVRLGYQHTGAYWGDPGLFVDEMAQWLKSKNVPIDVGERAVGVTESSHDVKVHLSKGRSITCKCVVIAGGAGSQPLLRTLGAGRAIYSGTGYSFTVDIARAPKGPLLIRDLHFGILPMSATSIRLAGTMEMGAQYGNEATRKKRVDAIETAARPYLRDVDWSSRRDVWRGDRPMTPDSAPLVGWMGNSRRIMVNAGHNMVGFGLSVGSAGLVGELFDSAAVGPWDLRPMRFVRNG